MGRSAPTVGHVRVLVVCAVADEARAAVRRLGPTRPTTVGPYRSAVASEGDPGIAVVAVACGIGEAAAASATATALALDPSIDLVLNAGIAGGFAPRVAVGDVVIANRIVAADLGAEEPGSPGARVPLSALGYSGGDITCDPSLVRRAASLTNAHVGTILTVSTVTASAERIDDFVRHHPEALAEAMEGHGAAVAAVAFGTAFLELRTISNPVGVRDPKSWSIEDALDALAEAMHELLMAPDSDRLVR